ncbi:hypothetical protein PENTCL1PPCAC_21495, partial [Pristionchus entomophagus]
SKYIVCTSRPNGYGCTRPPTTPIPERCPGNFYELSYGKCIGMPFGIKVYVSFAKGESVCGEQFGSMLPSIASEKENNDYYSLVNSTIGLTSFWIGLYCDQGKWAWFDGTPFVYDNFHDNATDAVNCDVSQDYAFSFLNGQWRSEDPIMAKMSALCALQADDSVPTVSPVICDGGWVSIDGSCFYFEATTPTQHVPWNHASIECSKKDAYPPTIVSRDQNERVLLEAVHFIDGSFTSPQFWLGLQCKNGEFEWLDGTPYAYNNLLPLFADCHDFEMGYTFMGDGSWTQLAKQNGRT